MSAPKDVIKTKQQLLFQPQLTQVQNYSVSPHLSSGFKCFKYMVKFEWKIIGRVT